MEKKFIMLNMGKKMRKYLIGGLLGLLAGSILYFVQPVHWKGQAIVKIGLLNSVTPIEPSNTTMERIKSLSFVKAVAKRAQNKEVEALLNINDKAGMNVKGIRDSRSIIITVAGSRKNLVKISIDSIAGELISKHDAILNTYQSYYHNELQRIKFKRNLLKKRFSMILNTISEKSSKMSENNEIAGQFRLLAIQNELNVLFNRSSVLMEGLSSLSALRTSLIEPASIEKRRIFSTLWRACLFGTLLGIFLSILSNILFVNKI